MPKRYIDRIRYLNSLIHKKGTGSPSQLAKRLGISPSRLYEYIAFLRDEGAPVRYSRSRQTYFYDADGTFEIGFVNQRGELNNLPPEIRESR